MSLQPSKMTELHNCFLYIDLGLAIVAIGDGSEAFSQTARI